MDEYYQRVEVLPGQHTHVLHRDVLDISRNIRLTKQGRTAACKSCSDWSSVHASMLASAISGGQWPQARLASAKPLTILDDQCQLCHAAVGTLAHRYECPATRPHGGWLQPDRNAEQVIAALPDQQQLILITRGMMYCKIPIPLRSKDASLRWRLPLPEEVPRGSTFYIDGSALDADTKAMARLGFAIVVVSPQGQLAALGYGSPPDWIVDSAGAETWAFYMVISLCCTVPLVVTDCMGILNTLQDGATRATSALRVHARIWNMIHTVLDSDSAVLDAQANVTWMPSHGSRNTIGVRAKSDSSFVSSLDWRANRLADAAAKAAALEVRVGAAERILHDRVESAYQHALAGLAIVTVAANNHKAQVIDSDGNPKAVVVRDSAALPRCKRARTALGSVIADRGITHHPVQPDLVVAPIVMLPSSGHPHKRRDPPHEHNALAKRRRMDRDHDALCAARQAAAWRDGRDARVFTPVSVCHGSASERLTALLDRIRSKAASG